MPAPAEIYGVSRETVRGELLTHPRVIAAVGIEAGYDRDHRTRGAFGSPRAHKEFKTVGPLDFFFTCCLSSCSSHVFS